MSTLPRWAFALALLPLAACNSTPAQMAATVPIPAAPAVSAQDQQFANAAAASDMFEIKSSQVALERSRNARTKAFAQKMIDDHTQSTSKLRSIAATSNIQLPADMDADGQAGLAAVTNARRNFDAVYFRQQVMGHQKAVEAFQNEIANGTNPDLKQFAQETLPIIQGHLAMAQGNGMARGRAMSSR